MSELSPLAKRILAWIGLALLVGAALYLASRIPRTLTVFTVASLIAFGVHPVSGALEKRMKRPLAIAIVYLSLLALLVVIAFLVIPATVAQMQRLITHVPEYVTGTQVFIKSIEDRWFAHFHTPLLPAGFDIQAFAGAKMGFFAGLMINSIGTIVVTTMTAMFIGVSSLVLSFYFLLNVEVVGRGFLNLFPPDRRVAAHALANEITRIFGGFIAGQFLLSATVGITIWAALALLGFHYALLIGVLAGFGYSIPFVGMVVVHTLSFALAAPQGMAMIGWVQVAIFTVARIADNVLVPKVMSESVGVSPIGVMFAVFAGGELFGLPGLVLGIPAAALIKVLYRFFIVPLIMRAEPIAEVDFPEPELGPVDISPEIASRVT